MRAESCTVEEERGEKVPNDNLDGPMFVHPTVYHSDAPSREAHLAALREAIETADKLRLAAMPEAELIAELDRLRNELPDRTELVTV